MDRVDGGYRSPSKWGCGIAFAAGLPLLLLAVLLAVLDSGRCEGAGPDCRSDAAPYGLIWLGIIAGAFCLAWALNARINRARYDKQEAAEAGRDSDRSADISRPEA